jgi:hypothetical protein
MKTHAFAVAAALLAMSAVTAVSADPAADFKAGNLDAAERGYAAALATNPKDQAAILGLARIRLYENRLDEADKLAGSLPDADNVISPAGRILATSLHRRKALEAASSDVPAGGTIVRFELTDPLPIVKVRVNGKDAFFLIDTGAPDAALDPAFATELGIVGKDAGNFTYAAGQQGKVQSAVVEKLQVGDAIVHQMPVTLLPTRNFKIDDAHRIDGVIGTGFLYHFLAALDYAHDRLTVRPRTASADFERDAEAKHDDIVPMWLVGDHFICARPRVNDGPERIFNIDTGGAGVGVMPSPATLADSHIVLDTAHASTGQGGGGVVKVIPFTASVTLGSIKRDDVPGLSTPEGSPYGIFPFDVGGSISHIFFRPYALTFDFTAMKMVIDKP